MHVIEHDDDRLAFRQVREQHSQRLEEARAGRLAVGRRPPGRRHRSQQGGEIVEQPAAEDGHLRRGHAAKVTVERLGPQAERGGAAKWMSSGQQRQSLGVEGDQLRGQPGLAHSGIGQHEQAADSPSTALDSSASRTASSAVPAHEPESAGRQRPNSRSGGPCGKRSVQGFLVTACGRARLPVAPLHRHGGDRFGHSFEEELSTGLKRNPPRDPTSMTSSSLTRIWPPCACPHNLRRR